MNLVVLSGRLSKEPILKYIPNSGKAVTIFDLAVEKINAKNKDDKVNFFTIQCWGTLAESVVNHLDKGRKILVNGYLKNNHWTDENNNFHKQEVIIATRIEYLDYAKNNNDEFEFEPVDMDSVEGELPF